MRRILLTCLTLLSGWAARGAAPVERIYISTDRTVYIAGDAVWCSLFCLDGNGSYSNESAVAYLELISTDGTAATAKIGLLEGRGAGSFRIPATASTGTILLREIDEDFRTPAADNMVYQNFPAIVFGFPMMLLATLAPKKPVLTLIILAAFFAVMNVILFRRSIFKKKGK